jgi:hypothetical protein
MTKKAMTSHTLKKKKEQEKGATCKKSKTSSQRYDRAAREMNPAYGFKSKLMSRESFMK